MSAVLLPGHGPRQESEHPLDRRWDAGCEAPASPTWPRGWLEADLVRAIAMAAAAALPGSVVASVGTYGERGRLGARLLPGAPVLQLHADAVPAEVGPDRATLWTWPTNERAAALAARLERELGQALPWPVVRKVVDPRIAWHDGVRSCLASVAQDSVLIESGYSDGLLGRERLPGLAPAIGAAIARGLAA